MTTTYEADDSQSGSNLLALGAPIIPDLLTPIDGEEGYHGGIGAQALMNDLLVIVDPWPDQELGHRCQLFWDDDISPVLTEIIDTPEELNASMIFRIPATQIHDGSAYPVFYRVRRNSGNETDSFKLNILVKRTLPGGVLSKPEPLGHPGLGYALTPDLKDGVDGDIARQGVSMRILPYQNITVFDRIVARWGDVEQVMHYPVTPEQISDPQNHPILIRFDEDLIRRAGDGTHLITYQVIDRCGNRPHFNGPWAIPTEVTVNVNRIPAPTVSGEQNGVLDPAYLTDIQVIGSGVGLMSGDNVHVHWQGRQVRETAAKIYRGTGALAFPIPLAWAHESDTSTVSITLRVERSGEKLTSELKALVVKTTISLTPPAVIEAYGERGEHLKMEDIYRSRHVTVQVKQYVGMAVGQTIRARWASARNTYDSVITRVDNVGTMNFEVPRLEVVDAIGSTVPVSFTVRTFPGGPLHRSQSLRLTIDAQAFVLTPPRLTPDLSTVTVRYPGMATGYQARVRLAGIETRKTDWQDLKTGATAEFSIPQSWIQENIGKTVLINYSVNRPDVDENSMFSQVLRVQL